MTVFEAPHYKAFLKSYIQRLPRRGRGEVSRIALALRVNPTLVSQILHGEKNLTLEQACDLTVHLGLNSLESAHFIDLVQWERAGTSRLKSFYSAKLKEHREKSLKIEHHLERDRELTETEKAVFYSSWIYSAVRLFTSKGKGQSIEEVCEQFKLSRPKARQVLQFLAKTGLCIEEKGKFRMGPQRTHLEAESPFILRHHLNWRLESMKRAESISTQELMFTSPISLSEADFKKIRERMIEMLKSVSETVKESPAETLAILNLDWIKI